MFSARVRRWAVFAVTASWTFAASPARTLAQGRQMRRTEELHSVSSRAGCLDLGAQLSGRFVARDVIPPAMAGGGEACEGPRSAEFRESSATPSDTPSFGHPVAPTAEKPVPIAPDVDQRAILERRREAAMIARARAAVLEVLQTDNACSSWLLKSDPHVLDTFSSLRFWVERDGPTHIVKERNDHGQWIERGPYVARTSQGTGANTNVALNANGAFFQGVSSVFKIIWPGGPEVDANIRQTLHVGPFDGATLEAQVITLIHELAHIVNAIPHDGLSPSGLNRSQESTELIVDRCKRAAKEESKRVLAGAHFDELERVAARD